MRLNKLLALTNKDFSEMQVKYMYFPIRKNMEITLYQSISIEIQIIDIKNKAKNVKYK